MCGFPNFRDSSAQSKISDLVRLLDTSLTNTQCMDGRRASRLLGVILSAYRDAVTTGELRDPRLLSAFLEGRLTLAAAFDLVANIEYLHGRVVNAKWIYCHRPGEAPRLYYSFLKQCPRCCLDRGLEARFTGAQHKPTSHHIGEITTVITALILQLITAANDEPLVIGTITKQSHDVDVIGYRDDLLILFEVKSSPMVTFPLVTELPSPLMSDESGDPTEYRQHSLVDMSSPTAQLALCIPHRDWLIPLGAKRDNGWPYDEAIEFFRRPNNVVKFLSAWVELYDAYRTPKVQRTGRAVTLAYLVNGWGDEIDSNKTKLGLGRTDDIKKGTYQLIKFGAYYRGDSAGVKVRSALVANLDPLFLREDYVEKLLNIRWAHQQQFVKIDGEYRISERLLRYLYDAIVTFNHPDLNDPVLQEIFNLENVADALHDGRLNHLLHLWVGSGPDAVVDVVVDP